MWYCYCIPHATTVPSGDNYSDGGGGRDNDEDGSDSDFDDELMRVVDELRSVEKIDRDGKVERGTNYKTMFRFEYVTSERGVSTLHLYITIHLLCIIYFYIICYILFIVLYLSYFIVLYFIF